VSQFIVGLGLMLMGLEFMKSGAIAAAELFEPQALAGYPLFVFLLTGLLLTAIIQSSSATIMITLSALYASAIPLASAAAVAIGADLGTTITALLGALAGSVSKKRVAAAIILFNVVADMIAFAFLQPLLGFVTDTLRISDPLYALVAFHSLFNLIGIAIFLPWVRPLSTWLGRRFLSDDVAPLRHIKPDLEAVPEAAVENITRETMRLIDQVAALNQITFGLPPDFSFYQSDADRSGVGVFSKKPELNVSYADVKQLEGEILSFALALQSHALDASESARLGQLIPAIRNAVHSAKSVRDVHHDLQVFRRSANDRVNAYHEQFRETVREFYETLAQLNNSELETLRFEVLVASKALSERLHDRMHRRIYAEVMRGELLEMEISTLLNVTRELYVSNQNLISALADLLLSVEAAEDFAAIPIVLRKHSNELLV
jgi:phosphate:Na+ symporter